VTVPEPLLLLERRRGYVMRCVHGLPLHERFRTVRALSGSAIRDLATRLVRGLGAYHESTGLPFADFNPRNVLLDPDLRAGLLDPNVPPARFDRVAARVRYAPWSLDLGYWTGDLAGRGIKLGILHPRATLAVWRLTIALIEAVERTFPARARDGFRREVLKVARFHLDHLAAKPSRKEWVVGRLGLLPLQAFALVAGVREPVAGFHRRELQSGSGVRSED
jgi:hypothetical protein